MTSFQALQEVWQDPDLPDDEKTTRMHRVWIEEFFTASCADPQAMLPLLRDTFKRESFDWRYANHSNQEAPMLDLRDRLPAITARSLVIVGTHDMMPISKGEEMRDGIAGAQLVVLQNSGHFAFLEEPELFRETIWSFLDA
jgi:pimeloyl-ACP methyl ester carboxylesterase